MPEVNLVEAVRMALGRAMADDPSVLVLGEDVGADGGVFRATEGLLARFGPERVFDTPLSESMFVGLAVGLGAQGFRPVVEFQFMGFIYPSIDQIVSHASRLRNRTRGRLSCPMVIRAPKAEAYLEGRAITPEAMAEAGRIAAGEAKPIGDFRASAEYRRDLIAVLTKRALESAYALPKAKRDRET